MYKEYLNIFMLTYLSYLKKNKMYDLISTIKKEK